jgi:hypothetical protein
VRVEHGLLDDRPDPGERGTALCRDRVAQDVHFARTRRGEAKQAPDRFCLPGAVVTEKPECRARWDREVHVVDGQPVAKARGQADRLNRWGRG